MPRDGLDFRHTPVRPKGWRLRLKGINDVNFILHYVRPNYASFAQVHDIEGYDWVLFDVLVSFCIACGRFIGFGNSFDVCWICKSHLESEEDNFEDF
jgi:hypothetical protein